MIYAKPGDNLLLVEAARSFLGVKFKHRGRNPSIGIDCAGLVVVSLMKIGIEPYDIRTYGREPYQDGLREVVEKNLGKPISPAFASPGDIGLFRFDREPHHIGIFGDYLLGGLSLIHSSGEAGEVVEHRLDSIWKSRICDVYRLPVE